MAKRRNGSSAALVAFAALIALGVSSYSLADEPAAPADTQPLSERSLANLEAMARLLGYVRFFHPSDQAAQADWDMLALTGVADIEAARNSEQLADRLNAWIKPVAPTVHIVAMDLETAKQSLERPEAIIMLLDSALLWPHEDKPVTVLSWVHHGINLRNQPGPYRSYRQETQLAAGASPAKELDPASVMALALTKNVTAIVPRSVYATDADNGTLRTLPNAEPCTFTQEQRTRAQQSVDAMDRNARFANIALSWPVLQHFYPYFDVVDTDWDAQLETALREAATDNGATEFHHTLQRMIAALHDGHGGVYNGRITDFWGPSLTIEFIEKQWVVTSASGSATNLVKPGDIIRSVDGISIAVLDHELAARISGATPQWIRYRQSQQLLNGPQGSFVMLEVENPDDGGRTVRIARDVLTENVHEPRPEKISELEPGIWYVNIDSATDDDVNAAMGDLAKADGIVLDLRGYPRNLSTILIAHLIDEAVTCAQWHVPVVTKPNREDMQFQFSNWKVFPMQPKFKGKVAFIIDGRAISYAETYMGIIENYKLAAIVGEPTAGTNGNITGIALPGGYHVIFTGMKVLKHDGAQHHGIGIAPTVPCSRTIEGVRAGRDELLERAVETVKAAE